MISLEKDIVKLYKDKFLSVQQIAENLNLSPSKIRYILDKNNIKRRGIGEAIRYLNVTKFHKGTFKLRQNLSEKEEKMKIAGAMLYWGEGTKSGNSVVISNSDPEMIKLFLKFLRRICGISESRIRLLLHIYSDQNEIELKKFWSKTTNVPESQFSKSYFHQKKKGTYKKTSKFGTVSLRYSDKELLRIINGWTRSFIKEL